MRRGNLSDLAHLKVTCKRRDRPNNVTPRRGRELPHQRYCMFHLRLAGDVIDT